MNFNDSTASLNFYTYTSLRQMMQDPSFNPSETTTLTFSHQKHIDFPPHQPLSLLKNLKILHLTHNNIEKFTASRLLKGTPLLQELDLSYNKIKNLDDIVKLGELVHLEKLDIRENPVSKSLIRLRLIEFLLFPKKNTSSDGVEALTATYREGQILKTDENLYKLPVSEDIDDDEPFDRLIAKPRANKFDHSKTDIRLSLKECPVPRKTNFPRLRVLNGEMISIQDVRRILLGEEIEKVLAKEGKEEGRDRSGESIRSTSQKLHEKYITSYQKKKRREKEAKEDEMWVTRQEQFSKEEKILKKEMRKEDSQKIEKRKIIEGKEGKSSESSLQESMESDAHNMQNNDIPSADEDEKEEEKELGKAFLVSLAATKARSKTKKGSRRDLLQFFGKKEVDGKEEEGVKKEEEKVQEVKQNTEESIKPKDEIRVPTVRLNSSPRRRTVLVKSESKPNFSLPLYSARKENEEQKSINPPPKGIIKLERVKENVKESEDTTILKDRYNLEVSNMENSAVELKTAASKNTTTDMNISNIPKAQENTTINLGENNGSSLYTDHMENTKTEDSIVLSNKRKVVPQMRFRAKSGTNLHNFLNKNPQRGSSFLIGRGLTTSRSESRLNNPFISTPLMTERRFIDNDITTTETARSKLEESSSCVSHTVAEHPEPFKDFRKTRVEGLRQKERQVFNIKNKLFCRTQKSPSTENSVPDIEKQARSSFSKSFSILSKTPAAKKSLEGVIALKDFYPQTQRAFPFTNAALEFLSGGGTGGGGTLNKTAVKLTPVQQSGRQTPGLYQAQPPSVERSTPGLCQAQAPPEERSPSPDGGGGNKQRRVLYSSVDGKRPIEIKKKVVIDGPVETLMKGENVKRKEYTIEDLLPSEKDGMPKRVRDQLLIGKGEKYESLKETGELLGELSLLMNQAKDLRDRIHVKKGNDSNKRKKKQDESSLKSREVLEFDDVTSYLRDYNNVEVLKLEDHKDLRQLIYLVHNDGGKKKENIGGDLSARKDLDSQIYQRNKREKQEEIVENLSIEGGVQRLKKIPRYMTNVNNKEIERVNRNVQLAAHTMRFREYQGDEATKKYYKEGIKVLRNIQSNMADLETSNKQYIAGKIPEEYNRLIKASLDKFNERNMKKREGDESEEKKKVVKESENKRFEYEETKEEKIKNYANTFKQRVKDLKKVKMRVEEYTKNGRKTIDDFLEHEKNELEKIHDKKSAFKDLVELTYTNKL